MSLTRHTVVVTGASTGIGRAAALLLARSGLRVFAGVRNDADAAGVRDDAQREGLPLEPLILDVVDGATIAAAVATVRAAVGDAGLWALVNNAGVVVSGPLEFLPLEKLRWQLEVNVVGQIAVTQAFLPLLRQARGRIVFTGSSNGYFTPPFVGPYAASKHAIEALCDALRRELKPWGLHVVNIQPGAIQTPIWDKSKNAAEDMLAALPAAAHEYYGKMAETMREKVAERVAAAIPVEICAAAIAHAVTAKRPKTRYMVGKDAVGQAILKWLPDRVVDWLIARALADR